MDTNIVTEIKRAANVAGLEYYFEDWQRANLALDKDAKFPVLVDVLPAGGVLEFEAGQVRDCPFRLFAILAPTNLDFISGTNAVILNDCKKRAAIFIRELNNGRVVRVLTKRVKYSTIYDKLDRNLTGISFEVQTEPIYGVCEEDLIIKK